MHLVPFVQGKYHKTINKQTNSDDSDFDIHEFIAGGLRMGLSYSEIKEMSYTQLYNLQVAYFDKKEVKHKPSQAEIDLIT